MKVVITQEHEVNGCCDCPHAQAYANWDSYDEDDYKCHATSDRKLIASYVFVKSDLPRNFPEWCPLKQKEV